MRTTVCFALLLTLATFGCGGKDKPVADPGPDTPPATNGGTDTPGTDTPDTDTPDTPDTPASAPGSGTPDQPSSEPPKTAGNNQPSSTLDLSYITGDFYGAWVLNADKVFENEKLAELANHEAMAEALQGVDPKVLDQAVLLVGLPTADMPVEPGVILRFNDASGSQVLAEKFQEDLEPEAVEFSGMKYWRPEFPGQPSLYVSEDGLTALIANEANLQKMLLQKGEAESPLVAALKQTDASSEVFGVIVMEPVRGMIKQVASAPGGQLPPQLMTYIELADHLKTARLRMGLKDEHLLQLELEAVGPESVAKLQEAANANIALAKLLFNSVRQELANEAPPEAQEMLTRASQLLDSLKAETQGNTVVAHVTAPEGMVDELVASLGPALDDARRAAKRMQTSNNAKQIALSQHIHHDIYNAFAANSVDKDGKATLSWRVHLLPFLEQEALYEQFKLDEPWDSPHNMALVAQMPEVYATVNDDGNNEQGLTRFQAFRSNGALMEPVNQPPMTTEETSLGIKMAQIADGTSNTIMFIQTPPEKAVPWTKPADVEFNPEAPLENLGEIPEEGLLVAFADGAVRHIQNTSAELWKKLVTINGGEVIDEDF